MMAIVIAVEGLKDSILFVKIDNKEISNPISSTKSLSR